MAHCVPGSACASRRRECPGWSWADEGALGHVYALAVVFSAWARPMNAASGPDPPGPGIGAQPHQLGQDRWSWHGSPAAYCRRASSSGLIRPRGRVGKCLARKGRLHRGSSLAPGGCGGGQHSEPEMQCFPSRTCNGRDRQPREQVGEDTRPTGRGRGSRRPA